MKYLIAFVFSLLTITAFGQKRNVKFYNPRDSIRYDELTNMMLKGRAMGIKDGKLVVEIKDSSYLHTNYYFDSLRRLINEIPLYRFLTYSPDKSYCDLQTFMKSERKDTIRYLSISGKHISKLPIKEMLKCKALQQIELIGTSVKKIPWLLNWKMFGLDSLKVLKAYNHQADNGLRFKKNSHIKTLIYRENPFSPPPKKMWRLKNLVELDLYRNDFRNTDKFSLHKFRKLKEVNLSHNEISIARLAHKPVKRLENLILSHCKLEEVPASIGLFGNLRELQLAENNISTKHISPKIGKLKKLEILSFYKNELDSVPSFLMQYPELEELDLYYNKIERIPPEIANLKKLRRLYLANNKLYSIPDEIGDLTALEELYLKHNRISYLPNSLCNLSRITDFHVNNNYLQGFPDCILSFKNLRDLDISYNEINSLPPEILSLSKLKLLWMRGITFDASTKEEALAIEITIEKLQKNGLKISVELD